MTLDSDFVREAALADRERPSIIHIRLRHLDRHATIRLLLEILPQLEEELSRGCIASVTRGGIRIKRLPILR